MSALLELTKSVANKAASRILDGATKEDKCYTYSDVIQKEIKAVADRVLETEILGVLRPTGLAILSEESGDIPAQQKSTLRFIVDPLDGTFNFVKGLGPSAVSIALWDDQQPVFGVIYDLTDRQLIWGGPTIGAYADGVPISVSNTSKQDQASICTGFPVRFDVTSEGAVFDFWRKVKSFAKVRMLGSAAVSLLHVARGAADVYSEQNIMLWDVAAGLAIVVGAGGHFSMTATGHACCHNVTASNAALASSVSSWA